MEQFDIGWELTARQHNQRGGTKVDDLTEQQGGVLIVDDDRDVLLTAELLLKKHYARVLGLGNPSDMATVFGQHDIDVVLLDMNFTRGFTSGGEGFYWLHKIKELSPHTQIILVTAYGEIALAVEAIKQGAADFLVKPWDNDKLISTVNTCLRLSQSQQKINRLESAQRAINDSIESGFGKLIGDSPAVQNVLKLIDKVAATDASVLILGENGTGKELVARSIHRKSARHKSPLISVDLGAISESLFESEMFGHTRGAFTDAKQDRAGRFEVADGGTLFLDEIGNLNQTLQAKLLGVLESRSVTRVGSHRPRELDIRLIYATNLSEELLHNEENFRRDLLYRINTVEIRLPPLRERAGDIPLLAGHYMELYGNKYNKPGLTLSAGDMARLESYPWPGNIRELQHTLERAVIVSGGSAVKLDEVLAGRHHRREGEPELNIAALEKQAIATAISRFDGNLTRVAKALGLGRTTLYRKMEKYGLSD